MQAATVGICRKGYDGTSMDEIATKASVSKQTIYKHFSDKDHLFAEIVLATTQTSRSRRRVGRAVARRYRADLTQDLERAGPRRFWTF